MEDMRNLLVALKGHPHINLRIYAKAVESAMDDLPEIRHLLSTDYMDYNPTTYLPVDSVQSVIDKEDGDAVSRCVFF